MLPKQEGFTHLLVEMFFVRHTKTFKRGETLKCIFLTEYFFPLKFSQKILMNTIKCIKCFNKLIAVR